MKNNEKQEKITAKCIDELEKAEREYYFERDTKVYPLRTCTACVYDTPNYYVLKSYHTIIACINKNTNTLYDCLRVVYGYTATSAQHISKFWHDYGRPDRYTAY